ncbi:hypothetical protein [Salinispira pacifica]
MRKTLLWAVSIAVVLILAACGNPSLLVPEIQDQNNVKIDMVQDGAVISGNAEVPVNLVYTAGYNRSNGGPDSMQIKLLASDGSQLRSFAIGQGQLASQDSFALDFPELDPGLYTLVVTLLEQGKVLEEKKVQFFRVQGSYRFTGISSFPSSFYPGSAGLLQAHLAIPSGADPYIRWSMNDKTIAEGTLSSGRDQVLLRAPAVEGVYNVTVELFPTPPPGGTDYSFTSSIKQSTELFVSKTQNVGEHELGPESSYYSLFHFRGDYRDVGERMRLAGVKAAQAEPVGTPDLRIGGSIFGYHLDGSSGFRVKQVILPFAGDRLSPFSLTIRAMADVAEINRTLFSAHSSDGSFSFTLRTDQNGLLVADISSHGENASASSGLPIFTPGDAVLMNLSVAPGERSTQLLWFKDGTPVATSTLPIGFGAPAAQGNGWRVPAGASTIGIGTASDGGFVGIIDEVGIYFRDANSRPSTDNRIFRSSMKDAYGDSLVYAEGFEGLFVPDELKATGQVSVGSGEMVLSPGSSVLFPRFLFQHEDLQVELTLDGSAARENGRIAFSEVKSDGSGGTPLDSQTSFIALDTSGVVRIPVSQLETVYRNKLAQPLSGMQRDGAGNVLIRLPAPLSSPVSIQFAHSDGGLGVQLAGDEYALRATSPDFIGIRMTLSQDAAHSLSFKVRSVLARTQGADLTSTLNALIPKEGAQAGQTP